MCDASLIRSGVSAHLSPDLDGRLVWTNTVCKPARVPQAQPKSRVLIEQCSFLGNKARYNGGAIAVAGGALSIHDSEFQRNQAASGGAIAVSGASEDHAVHITVKRTVFESNHLRTIPMEMVTGGGAVRLSGLGSLTGFFEHCVFHANWFGYGNAASGSAMLLDSSQLMLSITNSSFTQNWGSVQRGFIARDSSSSNGALVVARGRLMLQGSSFVGVCTLNVCRRVACVTTCAGNNNLGWSFDFFGRGYNTYQNWCKMSESMKKQLPGYTPASPNTTCSRQLSGSRWNQFTPSDLKFNACMQEWLHFRMQPNYDMVRSSTFR